MSHSINFQKAGYVAISAGLRCLAVVCLLLFTAVAVPVQAADSGNLQWVECPVTVEAGVRCGTLSVAENRSVTGGRVIRLSFAMITSAGEKRAGGPVAYLTGGPGFSAFAALQVLATIPLHQGRDIIVLEPRGYGYSDPWLGCDSIAALPGCHAEALAAGIDVEQYTTTASVQDYEELREALGYQQWNLFGVSYGTYWASLYSRMYPASIRAILMDSPYPLNAGYDWNRVTTLNSFERLFNACGADPACAAAYPDLRQRFIDSLRRLQTAPVTVDGKRWDPISAFSPVYHALYFSTSLSRTPQMIDALAREDYASRISISRLQRKPVWRLQRRGRPISST